MGAVSVFEQTGGGQRWNRARYRCGRQCRVVTCSCEAEVRGMQLWAELCAVFVVAMKRDTTRMVGSMTVTEA